MAARFTAEEAAAWSGFLVTFSRMDRAIDADLRAHDGIAHVEFEVLLRLWRTPGRRLRIHDLAADSILTRSGTSRLVDRLARLGLVERQDAPEDGRGSYATLTEAGVMAFERAADRHVAFVRERFLGRLSREEIDLLGEIWRRLAAGPLPPGASAISD